MEKTDLGVALGKGIVGGIPIVGPLIAEIVGHVIPNQRIDRLEKFLRILDEKVKDVDSDRLRRRFDEEQFVDLLEDGMLHASRALTENRREYIASVIEGGIKDEELEAEKKKILLRLLSELNDTEVIMLQSYGVHPEHRDDFFERHQNVLIPPHPTMESDNEEFEDQAIFDAQKVHLERLGLLRRRFKKTPKGKMPEFDNRTGMIKAQGYEITALGRLLLSSVGLETWP